MAGNYPLFKVHVDVDGAMDNIRTVLESGFINEGLQVTEFQNKMAEILEAKQFVMMNSCTSALTVALKLAGVGPGDEVVTTPMTCVATNTPIENLGGKIIWADIDAETGSIDPKDVARKITPKTKAVMCVAWAGTPCDLDELNKVCKAAGIPLIQDAAHAFGAKYKGTGIANHADYTCYSFQAIKHITSGDGGALAVKDPERFALAKKLKWFGYDRDATKDEKGEWKGQRWSADIGPGEIGYKFNMNNLSAAVGLSQIKHIGKILGSHQRNAKIYAEEFEGSNSILPLRAPANSESSYWVYTVLLKNEKIDRDEALEKLNAEGIAAGLVHIPNDMYTCFAEYNVDLPGVRYFADRQISLPAGWWLQEHDIRHIAARVKELCA